MPRKKPTISNAKKAAWKEFSRYIRLRDCLKTTGTIEYGSCVTCGKTYEFRKLQAGHFVPGRRNSGLFDERGCHAQCFVCNVRLGGNWTEYFDFMLVEYGDDVIEELKALRYVTRKFTVDELKQLEIKYRNKSQNILESS